jgi:hypothetical protein
MSEDILAQALQHGYAQITTPLFAWSVPLSHPLPAYLF